MFQTQLKGVFLNIEYNFIFQMIYSEVKENFASFRNKQQQRSLNSHPQLTNSRCSSNGFLNSIDITQSRMTELNYDHIIQPKNSKEQIKNMRCLSCQHWEDWAIESEHAMLLIEKKLIERQRALQGKMKQLKNELQEQNKTISAKQKQYQRLKIKDQQIILQLNRKIQLLQRQSKLESFSTIDRRQNNIQEKTKSFMKLDQKTSDKKSQEQFRQHKQEFYQQKQNNFIKKETGLEKKAAQTSIKQKERKNESNEKLKQFQKKLNYNLAESTRVEDSKNLAENIHNISSQESELVESIDISSNSGSKINQNQILAKGLRMKKKPQEPQQKQQIKNQKQSTSKYASDQKMYGKLSQENRKYEQKQFSINSQNSDNFLSQPKYESTSEKKILNKASNNSIFYQGHNSIQNNPFDAGKKNGQNILKNQDFNQNYQSVTESTLHKHKSLPGLIYNPVSHEQNACNSIRSNNLCMQPTNPKQHSLSQTEKQSNMSLYHLSCLYENQLMQQVDGRPIQIQTQSARMKSPIRNNTIQSKKSDGRPQSKSQKSIKNMGDETEYYQCPQVKHSQNDERPNRTTNNKQSYEFVEQHDTCVQDRLKDEQQINRRQEPSRKSSSNNDHNEQYGETLKKSMRNISNNFHQQQRNYDQQMELQNKNDLSIHQVRGINISPNPSYRPHGTNKMMADHSHNMPNHKHIISFHRKSSPSSNQPKNRQESERLAGTNTVQQTLNINLNGRRTLEQQTKPTSNYHVSIGHDRHLKNNTQITQTQNILQIQSGNKKPQSFSEQYSHKFANTSIKKFNQIQKKQYHDSQMNTAKTQKSAQSVAHSTLKTIKLASHPLNVQKSRFNQTNTDCSYLLNQIRSRTSKLGNDELVSVVSHSQGPCGQYVRNPQQRTGEAENDGTKPYPTSQMTSEIEKLRFENQNLKSYNRVLLQKLSNSRPKKY